MTKQYRNQSLKLFKIFKSILLYIQAIFSILDKNKDKIKN